MKVTKEKKLKKVKDKNKVNFWNYKATNPITMVWIAILRFLMIGLWVIAPIFIALSYYYDNGMKYLTGLVYTNLSAGYNNTDGEYLFGDVVASVELARKIIAPIIWMVCTIFIGAIGVYTYFSVKTYRGRAWLAFNQFFWPLLFAGIVWLLWGIKAQFSSGEESVINQVIWPKYQYWVAVQQTFSPWSNWMIAYQSVLGVWLLFGICTAIEASLIKKGKLDYFDFFSKKQDSGSLVHQVVEGRIVFGENTPKDLKEEMKKFKEEDRLRTLAEREKRAEQLKQKKNKKTKKQKKQKGAVLNEVQDDIKL